MISIYVCAQKSLISLFIFFRGVNNYQLIRNEGSLQGNAPLATIFFATKTDRCRHSNLVAGLFKHGLDVNITSFEIVLWHGFSGVRQSSANALLRTHRVIGQQFDDADFKNWTWYLTMFIHNYINEVVTWMADLLDFSWLSLIFHKVSNWINMLQYGASLAMGRLILSSMVS